MIAVIAILAAILFPVFISARESGCITRCSAKLKNISQALGMYRENWNGTNCHIELMMTTKGCNWSVYY